MEICVQGKKELVLATSSKENLPTANIVISLGFEEDKLMVADCSMDTTIKNLKENPRICVIEGYYKLKGKVKVFNHGKYFDKYVKIVASQDKTLKVKNAILINIEEVFDLAEVKEIL